ncbi:MAG: DUF362 domain-containing protein [Gemmatimonadota bacterium]|nr:DUF362 domain-containing protein [Gemmatimonadota bacterium]
MADRRGFLRTVAGGTAAAALACGDRRPWTDAAVRKPPRSPVAVLPAPDYDETRLVEVVRRGIGLFDLAVSGRRVVLKPNLVEFDPRGVINTHPNLIAAAVEAFRLEGAADVVIAEGPGHRRDNEYLIEASGLGERLRDTGATFVDLNHDRVRRIELATRFTDLGHLYLPVTVLDADLFVSMPKLKTHHWAGVTLSMKNMFGIIPGALYGWPKNVLHWAGIEQSILDINAALTVPRFNIVDGVLGMEGNGPIQGEARDVGVLVFGEDPVAVDAAGAGLMGFDPLRIGYLSQADAFLGNAGQDLMDERGEPLSRFRTDFRVLPQFEEMKIDPSPAEAPGSVAGSSA